FCGEHAFWHVFRSREPYFPRFYGAAVGEQYVAGGGWFSHYRSGAAPSGRGGAGDQPGGRADGVEQPRGEKVWEIFYLYSLSYDRPLFCHTPMCYSRVYGGRGTDHPG